MCDNTVINNIDLWNVNEESHPESVFISSKAEVFIISSLGWYTDAFIVEM